MNNPKGRSSPVASPRWQIKGQRTRDASIEKGLPLLVGEHLFATGVGRPFGNRAGASRSLNWPDVVSAHDSQAMKHGDLMHFSGRGLTNSLLFLSSFAPQFLALAFRFHGTALRFTCAGVCLLGVLALLAVR